MCDQSAIMEKKIKISVLGFSFNQTRTGTYGLVLEEDHGARRLMVIVGTPEAQSIAFELQKTAPPRPLAHDLFRSLITAFDIKLQEVLIYKYDDGVFFAKIILLHEDKTIELESRTSDAVAIALRTKSPIYTFDSIMREQGVVFNESDTQGTKNDSEKGNGSTETLDYSVLDKEELELMLIDAVEGEDYELASLLRDELKKKKKEEDNDE